MMRKLLFYVFSLISVSFILVSCSSDVDEPQMSQEEFISTLHAKDFGEQLLIITNAQTQQTRSTMAVNEDSTEVSIKWQTSDRICLFVNGKRYVYAPRIQSDGATVVLVSADTCRVSNVEGQKVYAVYCSNLDDLTVDGGVVSSDAYLGNVRTVKTTNPQWDYMYAVGTITGGRLVLDFKQMFGYVKVTVPASSLQRYTYLVLYSQNNYIVPTELAFDMDKGEFTSASFDDASLASFVRVDSVATNTNGLKEFYLPIYPTDGTNALVVAGYNEGSSSRGPNSSYSIKDLYSCDEPEDGIAGGELFCIDTRKSLYVTSSDYSYDGKVVKLESATKGNGIRLVFLGQGFADTDIKSGKYERLMRREMERFFAMEPFKSFRDYFACYMVYRVAKTNDITQYADTDRETIWQEALSYVEKAVTFQSADTVARGIVVFNGNYVGRSYTLLSPYGHFVSLLMENYPTIVVHEAGGHGYGLLADEYVEDGYQNRQLSDSLKTKLRLYHEVYGGFVNVDYDKENPVWSKFINDDRYTSEAIGAYEGAYTYGRGVYRPTDESIMNDHTAGYGFNAPCREAIYKRIRQYADSHYRYDDNDFYTYDAINRPFTTLGLKKVKADAVSTSNTPRHHSTVGRMPVVMEHAFKVKSAK